jgi:hypothetical protein
VFHRPKVRLQVLREALEHGGWKHLVDSKSLGKNYMVVPSERFIAKLVRFH